MRARRISVSYAVFSISENLLVVCLGAEGSLDLARALAGIVRDEISVLVLRALRAGRVGQMDRRVVLLEIRGLAPCVAALHLLGLRLVALDLREFHLLL